MVFNITFKHFYFHMWSQIKTLSCGGCHLGIPIYMKKKRNFVNDYLMSIHTYMGSISSVVSEETFIHFFHIVQCKNYILQWWPFWILDLNQTWTHLLEDHPKIIHTCSNFIGCVFSVKRILENWGHVKHPISPKITNVVEVLQMKIPSKFGFSWPRVV